MLTNKPEIIVFAGPNGSGKSSVTRSARIVGKYVNADDIKRESACSDLEAALIADKVINRYDKCLKLLPAIYEVADTFYLFDNSIELSRVALKNVVYLISSQTNCGVKKRLDSSY